MALDRYLKLVLELQYSKTGDQGCNKLESPRAQNCRTLDYFQATKRLENQIFIIHCSCTYLNVAGQIHRAVNARNFDLLLHLFGIERIAFDDRRT